MFTAKIVQQWRQFTPSHLPSPLTGVRDLSGFSWAKSYMAEVHGSPAPHLFVAEVRTHARVLTERGWKTRRRLKTSALLFHDHTVNVLRVLLRDRVEARSLKLPLLKSVLGHLSTDRLRQIPPLVYLMESDEEDTVREIPYLHLANLRVDADMVNVVDMLRGRRTRRRTHDERLDVAMLDAKTFYIRNRDAETAIEMYRKGVATYIQGSEPRDYEKGSPLPWDVLLPHTVGETVAIADIVHPESRARAAKVLRSS